MVICKKDLRLEPLVQVERCSSFHRVAVSTACGWMNSLFMSTVFFFWDLLKTPGIKKIESHHKQTQFLCFKLRPEPIGTSLSVFPRQVCMALGLSWII